MLVNSKKILQEAKANNYAVPQFNINNLEWTKYILESCEKMQVPVILGVSEGAAKYMGGYHVVSEMLKALIKDLGITIEVVLHLDHGSSFDSCKRAIDAGFTSVMIDASSYELEENIRITKEVTDYAKERNITVEAEIGHIGGTEDGVTADVLVASLEDSIKLSEGAQIDSIAPALGSVHGLYKGEPNLDFERMKEINEALNIPLVLHGGTGIDDHLIKNAIENGISKININTELQVEWHKAVSQFINDYPNVYDPRKVISSGKESIQKVVEEKIKLFFQK